MFGGDRDVMGEIVERELVVGREGDMWEIRVGGWVGVGVVVVDGMEGERVEDIKRRDGLGVRFWEIMIEGKEVERVWGEWIEE